MSDEVVGGELCGTCGGDPKVATGKDAIDTAQLSAILMRLDAPDAWTQAEARGQKAAMVVVREWLSMVGLYANTWWCGVGEPITGAEAREAVELLGRAARAGVEREPLSDEARAALLVALDAWQAAAVAALRELGRL